MNIVITGASKGIGFETALEFSKNAENKVFALSRNIEALKKLVAKAAELHGHNNVVIAPFDVTNFSNLDIVSLTKGIEKVDLLINNAGLLINAPFMELDLDDWRTIFEVNLFGVVNLTKALVPFLAKSSAAHIVNIGSMGGFQGSSKFSGLSAYSASKAALANLTECLAEELQPLKIAVNCLALGAVQTEMLAAAFPTYKAPLNGSEMAQFITSFGLNGHQYMNGKIIPVSLNTP